MTSHSEPEEVNDENARRNNRLEYLIDWYISTELARRSTRNKSRRSWSRIRRKLATAFVLLVVILAASLYFFESSSRTELLGGSNCSASEIRDTNRTAEKSVALIDQMSSDYPNRTFVQKVNMSASQAGYRFDYYPSDSASIDFFIHLPSRNYAMIILRTHGLYVGTAVVTSDTYNQYHRVIDQLQNRIGVANVSGSLHFSLPTAFIDQVICGRFPGTIILAMSCNLMASPEFSSAFIQRGARAFVGWNNIVSISRTDIVFASLAELLLGGHALGWSIQNATEGFGPDPFTHAQLLYAPVTQAALTI